MWGKQCLAGERHVLLDGLRHRFTIYESRLTKATLALAAFFRENVSFAGLAT